MIKIEELLINSDVETILNFLKLDLAEKGINLFNTFKHTTSNVQTACPFHKDGQERKPSFGVRRVDGKCHCFTCGWSGSITEMISEIMLKNDGGDYGRKWLIRNFSSTQIQERQKIEIQPRQKTAKKQVNFVTEEELDTYRYYHEYMYTRGLTDEIIELFDVGYDRNTNCLTFPVKDKNGNCVFVARRSVVTKYFNYPADAAKPVYALDKIIKDGIKKVVVCESILDCLTCWKFNIPAVALIGLGSAEQIQILKKAPVRQYVLALNPDIRGKNAQYKLRKALSGIKLLSEYKFNDTRDMNDLQEEILNLKEIL